MSIEESRKRQQADKQQAPALDLETVHSVVQEAVTESLRGSMRSLDDLVRQAVDEILARYTELHNLSAELGAIDAQLEAMRRELQFVRTAIDLLAKASQADALTDEEQSTPARQEEMVASTTDASPLSKESKFSGRNEGPAPIMLEVQRQGVKQ